MKRIICSIALAGLLTVPDVRAQYESISVETAVQVALNNRPALRQLDAALDAHRANRLLSLGLTGPLLGYGREGVTGGGFAEQKVGVYQEIPFPLTIRADLAEHRAGLSVLEADRAVLEAQIKESVKTAYIGVLYARELLALRGRAVELGYQLLRAVEARVEVGEAAEIDVLKAQLQEAEARDMLDEAERAYHAARYGLFRSMGLEPDDQRYAVQFSDSLRFDDVVVDQEAVLERLPSFPETARAMRAVDAGGAARRAARARAFPGITAGFWRQDFGSGYDATAVEIGLRIPLTEWLGRGASRRRARAQEAAAEAGLAAVTLDMKEDIERRWHSYDVSRRTLIRYERTLRGRGELLVQLTREGYLLGELDLLTLLDAQRTFVAGQVRYLGALRAYQLDLIRLERYAGRDLALLD